MIILIDNYDSFTYNLYHQLVKYIDVKVFRSDALSLIEIENLKPAALVISPGPGYPKTAGITLSAIKRFYKSLPILGVCLGHQAIGEAFGGKIAEVPELKHGKADLIFHDQTALFKAMPGPFSAARYHSLGIVKDSLPEVLKITAENSNGLIMGIQHKKFPVFGVQFHPESIITENGDTLIKNFISMVQ